MHIPKSYKWLAVLSLAAVVAYLGWSWYRSYQTTAEEICLAKNVYWESVAAREPEAASRQVAYATNLRKKMNRHYWGGSTICGVVYQRHSKRRPNMERTVTTCEFSWTCTDKKNAAPEKYERPIQKEWWQTSLRIARDELAGRYRPAEQFRKTTSYLNPYVLAKKPRGRWHLCKFERTLVAVGFVHPRSQHRFYRLPENGFERERLRMAEVPECNSIRTVPLPKPRPAIADRA